MDVRRYELMRAHILDMINDHGGDDGTIPLKDVVAAAQDRYSTHGLLPTGRVRNYRTFTRVDLEARCGIGRVPGRSPQRIRRRRSATQPPSTARNSASHCSGQTSPTGVPVSSRAARNAAATRRVG